MDNCSESEVGNRKTDRRVSRTRRQLREAILALVLEKGYDAVTVEDITERADLGRTTFYLHYNDKEELLLECISSIAEELRAQVPFDRIAQGDNGVLATIGMVFSHASENPRLYRIILNGEGITSASAMLREIISQSVEEFITRLEQQNRMVLNLQVPLAVFTNYFASSLLGFITWWLEKDMPYSPTDAAAMFQRLFFQGGIQMLGVNWTGGAQKADD
jgi:AcrR family transcriptional regulator